MLSRTKFQRSALEHSDCLHEMIRESGSMRPVEQGEGSSEELYKIQGFCRKEGGARREGIFSGKSGKSREPYHAGDLISFEGGEDPVTDDFTECQSEHPSRRCLGGSFIKQLPSA